MIRTLTSWELILVAAFAVVVGRELIALLLAHQGGKIDKRRRGDEPRFE